MLRNKLVRSDGSIIDSSVIISCEYTEEVNSNTNLSVGDATAAELTVEMLSTASVNQGEVLTYYMIEDGVEKQIGVFNVEKPTVASRTTKRFSAYDNIAKTEKQFSDWLRDNQGAFPMTLLNLVQAACSYCGVTLATTDFPRSGLLVNAFYADGITCRQILSWAGAIAGRFLRANESGKIEFAWYVDARNITLSPNDTGVGTVNVEFYDDGDGNLSMTGAMTVTDDGEGNVDVQIPNAVVLDSGGSVTLAASVSVPYMSNGLSYEAYTTDLIERVQIKQADNDVGVIYPATATGNCFSISGNMILSACSTEDITTVAAGLYGQLSTISYVPVSVRFLRTIWVRAGNIINIRDRDGNVISTYVMKVSVSPSGTVAESTGDKSYDSNVAVASEKYQNFAGKMLQVEKSIDGLKVVASDLGGRTTELEVNADEIETSVSAVREDTTKQITKTLQDCDKLVQTALESYVTTDELNAYKTTVSTEFTQSSEDFAMNFKTVRESIDAVDKDLQEKYNERISYIRFEDGNIILGVKGNPITLVQRNDRISFMNGATEVAYFAKDKMYVTDGEFLTQLCIGKFAFTPGTSGNLSFKKVKA